MVRNSILCYYRNPIPSLFVLFSCLFSLSFSFGEVGQYNSYTVSSFRYPQTKLNPYDLRYIRVDLPPWFSSMSMVLESDVDLDTERVEKVPKSSLPMICFRDGSPPLPDASNKSIEGLVLSSLSSLSSGSFDRMQGLQNVEQCYPMQKNITVKLTNEQISPGVWYFGLFNGVGSTRTQSKMINRGPAYSFRANVSVEGCTTLTMWGQYCNQTVDSLSCGKPSDAMSYNRTTENVVYCNSSFETSCHEDGERKVYSLDVVGIAEQLTTTAMNVNFNATPSNNSVNNSAISLMCFARHGAMPSETLYDYSGNINKAPLIIRSPKVGRWYITILAVNLSKELGGIQDTDIKVCYSVEWKILECPVGKAGPNCTWERYALQTVLRTNAPFESYYLPVSGNVSSNSANFLVEPLLSNSSYSGELHSTWTYFLLDIPRGAAGGNIHIRLTSDAKINYEIYARFGGLPSLGGWDYYYANKTSSSDGSMFFMLYNSSDGKVDFYILYVKEGTWSFGLRHLNTTTITSKDQTTMSISLDRCPNRCSSHGSCKAAFDASGLTSYSFCSCDRNHGGFDCSVEIVSHRGHIVQSIFLIASNAAAVLPAFWALRQKVMMAASFAYPLKINQEGYRDVRNLKLVALSVIYGKAFAEWVLFTSSGISSGLYHACDVGTWCALSFGVLQFMDFWLSFMAVVSTFIYLSTIDEVLKRTIHTAVAILTALMAITKATRPANIFLVMAIGTLGLLIGWLIEFSIKYRSLSFPTGLCLNVLDRWPGIRRWLRNLIKTLLRRFHWGFVLAGFTALAMAAISWKLETSESYWIWHSIWHITIYTSSFFFLCSKAHIVNSEAQRPPDGNYELTRQDSLPRGE